MKRALHIVAIAMLALASIGCSQSGVYNGIAPARQTGGPRIVVDLAAQPPQLPFPNDLLTRVENTSPTGLRVDAAILAPSLLEESALGQLDLLDGFGTYAPITVSFDQDLDALDLWTKENDADATNDGVYLVDLTTGALAALDFNGGHFPLELPLPQPYFLNDPLADVTNLVFPISGPAANLLHPNDPAWPDAHGGIPQASDDLLQFYERSTRTLILRPILPLAPGRKYAVVLTDRLLGTNGLAVQSPFAGINHAEQTRELQPLTQFLPPGTALSDIAFAWSFTTQTITEDLEAVQQGLNDAGPLSALSERFKVLDKSEVAFGLSTLNLLPEQGTIALNQYILPAATLVQLLQDPQLAGVIAPSDPQALASLIQSLGYIDYFVSGNYPSPDLLTDPDRAPEESAFEIDPDDSAIRTSYARVPFLLAVPKIDSVHQHTPPFPTVLASHDNGGSRLDPMLTVAGIFAQYGLATIAIDGYGQGLTFDPATELFVRSVFAEHGLDNFADALLTNRARDLDGDGLADPAGDSFTAQAFHTRDVQRQNVVDLLQLSVLLRSFTGNAVMNVPGDLTAAVAGDFNLDGIPDVGGPAIWPADVSVSGVVMFHANTANPGTDEFAFGFGTGGATAAMLAALEPTVRAAAPVGAPGGFSDLTLRTSDPRMQNGALLESFGPLLASCDYSPSISACANMPDAVSTLVWNAADGDRQLIVPIAALSLSPGDAVIACDLTQATGTIPPASVLATLTASPPAYCRAAFADANGQLRLPLNADGSFSLFTETPQDAGVPEMVQSALVRDGDQVLVLLSPAAGGAVKTIDTFQYPLVYDDIARPSGSPLRAISSGYGRDRNTPAFRKLAQLSQTLLERGDPINYAAAWGLGPAGAQATLAARLGVPVNVLAIGTLGDSVIPIATQIALARAAGFVEMNAADPDYGIPIDRVLIDAAAVEGVARLPFFADPAAGPLSLLGAHLLCDPGSDCSGNVVADAADLSCDANGQNCTDGLGAPRLSPPILQKLWRPTIAADGTQVGVSALELPLLARTGAHDFQGPQPAKPFDTDLYLANQIARYFETRGTDLEINSCQAAIAACPWNSYPPPY